jgi:hypothetical protein
MGTRFGSTMLAAFLVFACSSSSSSGKTVKDQAGRSCTIPDTGGLTVSCDKAPQPAAGCTGGATACFVQGYAPGPTGSVVLGPAAICAACCSGNQSVSSGGDCSPIVCATLDDCPAHGFTMCTNGGCY